MTAKISRRLAEIVEALPLRPGMRVLEIGCGPGVAARAVLERLGRGHVLAIGRSAKAIEQARAGSIAEIASGQLDFRCVAVEDFVLPKGERGYDLAFAVRVGALDGRHPEVGRIALDRLRHALAKNGMLFVDGGNPLRMIRLGSAWTGELLALLHGCAHAGVRHFVSKSKSPNQISIDGKKTPPKTVNGCH